ncbi:MAG: hypothetical protein NTX79_00540 [Candidatus Micrarchaeota archaeon]|nr:hypothetical protein [Candidatus Micrarchaeota archaeon]
MRLLSLTKRLPAQPQVAERPGQKLIENPGEFRKLVREGRPLLATALFLVPLLEHIERKAKEHQLSITLPCDLSKAKDNAIVAVLDFTKECNELELRWAFGMNESGRTWHISATEIFESEVKMHGKKGYKYMAEIDRRLTNGQRETDAARDNFFFRRDILIIIYRCFGVDFPADLSKLTPEVLEKMRAKRAQA